MKARGAETDPVYAYLRRLADGEESAELGGCSMSAARARSDDCISPPCSRRAQDDGALAGRRRPRDRRWRKFWHALPAPCRRRRGQRPAATPAPPRLLGRLPAWWSIPLPQAGVPGVAAIASPQETLPFDWAREAARHVGTVAHRLFAQIAREGIAAWDASRVASLAPRLSTELAAAGVDEAELPAAAAEVTAAVRRMLIDPRGRWLVRPRAFGCEQRMGAGGMGREIRDAHSPSTALS
jgi:hypothetical protein